MNSLWSYFWPVFAAGVVIGAGVTWWAFRRLRKSGGGSIRDRKRALAAGIAAALAVAALWHWPLGAADRLTGSVERIARITLDYYELPNVSARLDRSPLSRTLVMSGPANDFQRRELVRIMSGIPGVGRVTWRASGGAALPLLAEAAAIAAIGFLLGLLVAYLVELRRRSNAEWRW